MEKRTVMVTEKPEKRECAGMVDNRCVLLFVKAPAKGLVKTRLARSMDENVVLRLYECFVLDMLDMLKAGSVPFRICYTPVEKREALTAWLGSEHSYYPQSGADLGERMENAFQQAFSGGLARVLIIGSDIPDLPSALLEEAFESLETHDAVIGPANDGGYYLIGFTRDTLLPAIFHGLRWSTETVYRKTMETFERNDYRVHVLPQWDDVDTIEDLEKLIARNLLSPYTGYRTLSFLRAKMLEGFGPV